MTKQAVIAIVVGVIIVLGAAGAFLYSKNQNKSAPATTSSSISPTSTQANGMMSSVTDIFSSGQNRECNFSVKNDTGETKGVVYVSGNKAYGDFDMTTNGKSTSMYIIRDEDIFYMWGDSLPTGMKITMSVNDMAAKMQGNTSTKNFDPNQKMDVKCVDWTPDTSKFTPPSNVKFISVGAMMPTGAMKTTGTLSKSPTGNSSQCSVCSSLTGDAKTTCLNQLNCQ